MAHYGAKSAKREKMFSNNKWVGRFCLGTLTKAQRGKLTLKTTKRTANGGYQGTKALKSTQLPSSRMEVFVIYLGVFLFGGGSTQPLRTINPCDPLVFKLNLRLYRFIESYIWIQKCIDAPKAMAEYPTCLFVEHQSS